MKRVVFAGFVVGALCGAPAFAADMPVKGAPMVSAPALSWTGCYIGGNTGGASNKVRGDSIFGLEIDHRFSGWVGGGQIGCDTQMNNWVLGIEGMWDFAGTKKSVLDLTAPPDTIDYRARSFATLAAKVGFLPSPNTQVYAKFGYGLVNEKVTYNCTPTGGCLVLNFTDTVSKTFGGFDLGGGLRWMLSRNWDFFIEYDHIFLSSKTLNFQLQNPGGFQLHTKESFDKVLVGLNYRFDPAGKSPVVAKY